ncbi:MAG: DMT family transporter [Bdellovibrionales bacterium]|nr:DMT family transporter [Bdellovibrionales bacterium]
MNTLCSFWFSLPFYLLAFPYLLWMGVPIVSLGGVVVGYVFLRALTDSGAEWFKMASLKHGDLSLVTGVFSLYPVFMLITSPIITGDVPSVLGGVGVIIVTIGVFVLTGRSLSGGAGARGIWFAVCTALLFSLTSCFDRLAALEAHPIVSAFWMTLLAGVFSLPPNMPAMRRILKQGIPAGFPVALLLWRGLFDMLFMTFKLFALQYLQAPYVAALTNIALLISILAGGFIYKEQQIRRRFIGGVVILVGSAIVALNSQP